MKIAAYGELSLHVSVVPTHAPAPADRQFLLRGVDMEVGGSPHYVAAQASAQGDSVLLVGTVAPDPAGRWVRDALTRWGPPATSIHVVDVGTRSTRLVLTPDDSGGDIDILADPADGDVDVLAHHAALSDGSDYAHLSCFPGTERLRDALVGSGVPLIADFGFLPWRRDPAALARAVAPQLVGVAVAVFNGSGAAAETVRLAREAARSEVRVSLVTFGKDGALVCDAHTTHRLPARNVQVVNPVGAGDTLTTAFVHAWHHGASLDVALDHGQAAAARHVSRHPAGVGAGARTGGAG
ncbi:MULTISPECIES: carbohydrate kinase family protein [Streptomyces]|uniref:carbohydrate kinase family protein n=1 Tax=Streptomyces TaxID=1883 RepID=UPI000241ABD6|nr:MULTISPECIES: carbohydrate kinase family protein [Streptomyces]EHM28997.1 ribokinase family sugar kinase [Streptomyces sp. W007]MCX4487884.1 carbohydrate kinase family protein [Streptomyces anulatus]MCX4521924.1 carbohydrate kinase family protein [Streptomyces anulatus]MCX4604800.1 carbohydrate kinase family protein [Streptomyces anulatus]WSU77003.1 carbohydrate kinase family protein [Streptomyces anulatus]